MRGFGFPRKVIRGDREFPRATLSIFFFEFLFSGIRANKQDKLRRRVSTEKFSKHQMINKTGAIHCEGPNSRYVILFFLDFFNFKTSLD